MYLDGCPDGGLIFPQGGNKSQGEESCPLSRITGGGDGRAQLMMAAAVQAVSHSVSGAHLGAGGPAWWYNSTFRNVLRLCCVVASVGDGW